MTERMAGLKLRMASASGSVMSGFARTRSMSSSVRVNGTRSIVNASAPTWLTIAFDTIAFMPWMSETTVTIDITATMLPSTVISDRSLLLQIDCSASQIDSPSCIHLDGGSVGDLPDGVEGAGDHLVAGLQAGQHLEVPLAR